MRGKFEKWRFAKAQGDPLFDRYTKRKETILSTHELFTYNSEGEIMSLAYIAAEDDCNSLRIALNYRNLCFSPHEKHLIKIRKCDE